MRLGCVRAERTRTRYCKRILQRCKMRAKTRPEESAQHIPATAFNKNIKAHPLLTEHSLQFARSSAVFAESVLGEEQGPAHADEVPKVLHHMVPPATPGISDIRSWAPAATATLVHVTHMRWIHVRGQTVATNHTPKQMRCSLVHLDNIYKTQRVLGNLKSDNKTQRYRHTKNVFFFLTNQYRIILTMQRICGLIRSRIVEPNHHRPTPCRSLCSHCVKKTYVRTRKAMIKNKS